MVTGDGTMQAQLPIRLDAFVFGMCAGRFAARTPLARRLAPAAFYAGLLALFSTPLLFSDLPTGNHYYTLKGFVRPLWIQLGVILMLLGMTGERHPGVAIFGNRVSVGLGLISYSIYLLHVPVMEMFIMYRASSMPLAAIPLGLPLLLAAARCRWCFLSATFRTTDRAAVPASSRVAPSLVARAGRRLARSGRSAAGPAGVGGAADGGAGIPELTRPRRRRMRAIARPQCVDLQARQHRHDRKEDEDDAECAPRRRLRRSVRSTIAPQREPRRYSVW